MRNLVDRLGMRLILEYSRPSLPSLHQERDGEEKEGEGERKLQTTEYTLAVQAERL